MRRFLLWSFFLAALGVLAGLLLLVRRSVYETPRSAYELAVRTAFGPDRDPELAFRHLDFALRGATAENDRELLGDILKARARLYTSVGSLARARVDYEEVLARYRPDELESQISLAWILLQLDEDEEAMRRVDAVLARDPTNSKALAFRGEILVGRAEQDIAQALDVINVVLPASARQRARAVLVEASALLPSDPRRIRIVQELRALFPAAELPQENKVLEALDSATARIRSAREALVSSFEGLVTSDTLSAYFQLLDRGAGGEVALEFALATLSHPRVPASPALLQRVLGILAGRGQPHLAADVVARHLGDNIPSPGFYATWCSVLYQDERWEDLIGVAKAMALAGSEDHRSLGLWYIGVAEAHLERWDQARAVLRPYVLRGPVEPFPGALARAWQLLARCYREEDKPVDEAGALRTAILNGRGQLEDEGLAWLRLYELAEADPSPSKNRFEMERSLLSAAALLPERAEELVPLWEDLGRRNLDAARIDLRPVFEELLADQRLTPTTFTSPYAMLQLAEMFAAEGMAAGVVQNCTRLLGEFPGFLPALDMLVDAYLSLGPQGQDPAARFLMERLRHAGPDPLTLQRLDELRPGVLGSEQVLEIMRIDPAGYGRRRLLDDLLGSDRAQEALRGLLALPDESLDDGDWLLAARLLLDAERGGEAEDVLARLSDDPQVQAQAAGLRLQAALEVGDLRRFDDLLDALARDEDPGLPGLVTLLDPLLARGEATRALRVARALDAVEGPRNGRALLRLAQAHILLGEREQADESLARAEAFLVDGSAEVGYLVRAVIERDWSRLPELVGDVRGSGMPPSLLGSTLLDVLGEQHGSAAKRIAEGLQRFPEEPLWQFLRAGLASLTGGDLAAALPGWSEETDQQLRIALRGSGAIDSDPRDLVVHVLGLLHPAWTHWAVADLERVPPEAEGGLWPSYLAARGLMRIGQAQRAADLAEALVARWPRFLPAWDLLEQSERALSAQGADGAAPDEVSAVRWRQRRVLGAMSGAPSAEMWMGALAAFEDGDLVLAKTAINRALDASPDDLRYRLTQIRLYAADRDWVPALQSMGRALEQVPATSDSHVVERAFQLHRDALRDDPAASLRVLVSQQRDLIASRFQSDPLVALELARLDVAETTGGPEVGLGRALARLSAFRKRTKTVPLESMRKGMTRAWFDFYVAYDPLLAGTLAMDELRVRPGSIDLWRLVSESKAALGRLDGARADRESLLAMLPFEEDARARVELLSHSGQDEEGFEGALLEALRLDGAAEPDFDLRLARGRFLVNAGCDRWGEAVEQLERLWTEVRGSDEEQGASLLEGVEIQQALEEESSLEVSRTLLTIGRLYALTLCWNGAPGELERAREVLPHLERVTDDAYERNFLIALDNLTAQVAEAGP